MKVVYLITRADRGGAQVHVLDLIANLPPEFSPVLITGEDGYLSIEARNLGVLTYVVPSLRQPVRPLDDLAALIAIIRLLLREKPALVHAHTSKAGLLGRLAGFITNTPVVFTAHTWSFADGISRWQRRLAVPCERLAAFTGGTIITVSQANARLALRYSITKPRNLVSVWNGVPDVYCRADPGSRDDIRIIMVARFVPQKDQSLLVRAMSQVTGNWRLQFAGDGWTRSEVEETAESLGVRSRVDFLGDRSDTCELLARSDLFVLASKWEGLPISILEAMRAGLPVIATRTGGVEEAVEDGVTGFLTSPGGLAELRDCIQNLIRAPTRLHSMGEKGRRRYEEHFRVERMIDETLNVYRKTMLGRHEHRTLPSLQG
jgi:glycosyltransferase involved in cell wall biosynthesis